MQSEKDSQKPRWEKKQLTIRFKYPSNFILMIVERRYLCCGSNCFVLWSRIFVLFGPYVRFNIFSLVRVNV